MNLRLLLAMLAVSAAYAGRVSALDVSSETTQLVRTGDTLVFHLSTWNFAKNATRLNLRLFATDLNFALVTSPVPDAGAFDVTLASEDQFVTSGELAFTSGTFTSGAYTGEVSTLQGYIHLSSEFSKAVLDSGGMAISLRNQGPDVVLGLDPYLLPQDLFAGLSGGPLTVGALPGWVELEPASEILSSPLHLIMRGAAVPASNAVVPELGPMVPLLTGLGLFLLFSALLKRVSRPQN